MNGPTEILDCLTTLEHVEVPREAGVGALKAIAQSFTEGMSATDEMLTKLVAIAGARNHYQWCAMQAVSAGIEGRKEPVAFALLEQMAKTARWDIGRVRQEIFMAMEEALNKNDQLSSAPPPYDIPEARISEMAEDVTEVLCNSDHRNDARSIVEPGIRGALWVLDRVLDRYPALATPSLEDIALECGKKSSVSLHVINRTRDILDKYGAGRPPQGGAADPMALARLKAFTETAEAR